MIGNIKVKTIKEVMALSDEERSSLAELLKKDMSTSEISGELSKRLHQELEKQQKKSRAEINKLKQIPAAISAAYALDRLDTLAFDLQIILDAARETDSNCEADAKNVEGHFKMLLRSVSDIADKMNDVFVTLNNGYYQNVFRILIDECAEPELDD